MARRGDDPPPSLPVAGPGLRPDDADLAERAWDRRLALHDASTNANDDEPSDWRITLATFGVFAGGIAALTLMAPSLPLGGLLIAASAAMGAETARQKHRYERWHQRRAALSAQASRPSSTPATSEAPDASPRFGDR